MTLSQFGFQGSGGYVQQGFLQGTQVAQMLPGQGSALWIVKMGARLKNIMPSSTIAFALWNGGTTPGAKLGNSDRYALPYSSDVFTTTRKLQAAVLTTSGQSLALGHLILGTASGDVNDWYAIYDGGTSHNSYYRGPGISSIQDPFGVANDTNVDGMNVWIYAQINRAPNTPTISAPANGSTVNTGTPTITGNFSDPDEVLYDTDGTTVLFNTGSADKMKAYQIVVKNSSGVTVWSSGVVNASGSEQTNRQFSMVVGTTLASGVYTLQTKVQDLAGAWSTNWSSTTFTVSVAKAIATAPSTKQTSLTPSYTGQYTNTTTDTATQYQMRILRNGGPIFTSAAITLSPALTNGQSITATTAALGAPTLSQGVDYQVQYMFRYGASNLWTPWSDPLSFRENGPPSKPTNVKPSGVNIGRPSYPTITAQLSDLDDTASSLTATVEITRPDNSVVTMTTGTNDGTGKWTQTTTVTQFTALDGVYKVRVQAKDTAGLTSPWSDYATITWGSYPVIAVTSLTPKDASGNVTGKPMTLDWTVAGTDTPTSTQQYSWYIQVLSPDFKTSYYESGWQYNQTTISTFSPNANFVNNGDYVVVLWVYDSSGFYSNNISSIHVQYTPPASITPSVNPVPSQWETMDEASMVQLNWTASGITPSSFNNYRVWRKTTGDWKTIAIITDQSQVQYLDRTPPVGAVSYAVTVEQQIAEAAVPSNRVEVATVLSFNGSILTDIYPDAVQGVTLLYGTGRSETVDPDITFLPDWDGPPTGLQGASSSRQIQVSAIIPPDAWLQQNGLPARDAYIDAVRQLTPARRLTATTLAPRILCYRDGRGRYGYFMQNSPAQISDDYQYGTASVSLSLQEVSYDGDLS